MVKECAGPVPATALGGGGGWLVCQYIQLLNAGGMASAPVQAEKGRPGGPIQNISDVGEGGQGACLVRNRQIGVFTHSLHTRDHLPVNNSLHHNMQILFR